MPYKLEEDESLQRQRLSSEATNLAVQGRWEEAAKLNREIIERFPNDIKAYNRLGRALTEQGDFAQAREAYLKALEFAPNNVIAKKNLARLTSLPESIVTSGAEPHKAPREPSRRVAPEFFTAEMGKTGVVSLCQVASDAVLARMGFGVQVYLRVKEQHLVVENESEEYLGEVEPKQRLRLTKLMEGGNRYAVAILSHRGNELQVLIREVYQHPSQVGHPSFPVKATERLRPRFKGSLLRHRALAEEGGAIEEIEYPEEEEYSKGEEESLPEGFSVIGEDGEKERFEL